MKIHKKVPSLVGGKWFIGSGKEVTNVYNPAVGEVISETPMGGKADVDLAVDAASKAFEAWSNTPATKRADIMHKYRSLLESNFEELSKLISLENGKTLAEAKGDMRRGFEVVDFACNIAHLIKGESLPQVANHIDGVTMKEALGVCAGISPYNFPAMVPMWMFPMAIACGNTFVLKPSEKVPLTAVRLAELFEEAGLPEGVFNIIHGGKEVVDSICTHPDIKAISFVGSSRIAKYVYTLGSQHGKRVQAGGAAKNALIVMPDSDPDSTLRAIMGSAFGCAGQRCMAGSLLMGVGETAAAIKERVIDAMSKLKVGNPLEDLSTDMGPVIDKGSQERIIKIINETEKGGSKVVSNGTSNLPDKGFFVSPTLVENVTPETPIFSEEVFGPVLSMVNPSSLKEAIQWLKKLNYGNGATLFTSSGASAREFTRTAPCGMLGINVGVPAPMSQFAFTGWNDSFYGDLHMQGTEGVMFYTRQRTVLSRWDNNYESKSGW